MSKRHYFDNQDDADEAIYSWLGSRHADIEAIHMGKLSRKWRNRGDDFEGRQSTRRPKRVRQRLN